MLSSKKLTKPNVPTIGPSLFFLWSALLSIVEQINTNLDIKSLFHCFFNFSGVWVFLVPCCNHPVWQGIFVGIFPWSIFKTMWGYHNKLDFGAEKKFVESELTFSKICNFFFCKNWNFQYLNYLFYVFYAFLPTRPTPTRHTRPTRPHARAHGRSKVLGTTTTSQRFVQTPTNTRRKNKPFGHPLTPIF